MAEHSPTEWPGQNGQAAHDGGQAGLRLTALSVADLARLLARAGARSVSEEMIRRDLESGAPANANGTVNLVHYAAWLAKETASRGD
jgi:hypothetical protein